MVSNKEENVYWMLLQHGKWDLYIAATNEGLCYMGPQNVGFDELEKWVKKRLPSYNLIENHAGLQPYAAELIDYLERRLTEFLLPIDIHGTDFQRSVWEALREIPYGETVSYTDISVRIGKPSAVRAVGTAIGKNPVLIIVPCHRVIAKSGALAGFRGGLDMKKDLLALEQRHAILE